MKKVLVILLMLVSLNVFSQEKYIYNQDGLLKYIVKDSLLQKSQLVGDIVVETSNQHVGGWVQYKTTKASIITNDNEIKQISIKHEPLIFGKTISRKSLNGLIQWLNYVKGVYAVQGEGTKYAFTDESLELTITITNSYKKWYLVFGKFDLEMETIDSFINDLENLVQILNEHKDELSI